jgi:hypothetical protein
LSVPVRIPQSLGRTTTRQPRTGPEEEPWPILGNALASLGVETKAPQPRPGGSRERGHHQRRSTGWGRASFWLTCRYGTPPAQCVRRASPWTAQNSDFPESPMPPCRLPQAADDSSNSRSAGCQKGLPNVSSLGGGDDVAVAKLGMPRVARRARGRCPLMTNVPSTEAARRHEWSTATLRIHTERDGRCSYCSERGSTDPWPCLMARLAMHAKGATTPPPGDAPE